MKSILIAALCAVTFTAQAEEAKRDTIHKYTIDKQAVEHFDGSQLEGKHISKYIIAYKENGNVVEKHHVIYTGDEAEKTFTMVGDADGSIIVSKNLGPLMIVDGKEVSEEGMALIKSEDVASVNVFEPGSKIAEKYGEKASKGVVIVTTKSAITAKASEPLVVVDGKEVSQAYMNKVKPEEIDHIDVLKPESKAAKELYGEKGKNGVIVITTKAAQKK